MTEDERALLEEVGIIILPARITHETYAMVAESLVRREKAIRLLVNGTGGEISSAFAMVDLIREHGQVTGLLLGEADSSHGVIWLACRHRYVYPSAALGVHMPALERHGYVDSQEAYLVHLDMKRYEDLLVDLLQHSCPQDIDFRTIVYSAGSSGMQYMDAKWLVDKGVALPSSQLRNGAMKVTALRTATDD
jgi:ATP-dependent protease ClpP protease subunit